MLEPDLAGRSDGSRLDRLAETTENADDHLGLGEPRAPYSGQTFSGKFIVRVPPEAHRDLAIRAAEEGVSLNRPVSSRLSRL